jgi:hypothetical protein
MDRLGSLLGVMRFPAFAAVLEQEDTAAATAFPGELAEVVVHQFLHEATAFDAEGNSTAVKALGRRVDRVIMALIGHGASLGRDGERRTCNQLYQYPSVSQCHLGGVKVSGICP